MKPLEMRGFSCGEHIRFEVTYWFNRCIVYCFMTSRDYRSVILKWYSIAKSAINDMN